MRKIKIVYRKINEIYPSKENSRKHPDIQIQKIMKSIQLFGPLWQILIDKDNKIIAGEGRYKAYKKLKYKLVPTYCAEYLTEEQIKAFRIADNKLAELSIWDDEGRDEILKELKEMDFDMEAIGYDADFDFNFDFNFSPDEDEEEAIEQEEKISNIIEAQDEKAQKEIEQENQIILPEQKTVQPNFEIAHKDVGLYDIAKLTSEMLVRPKDLSTAIETYASLSQPINKQGNYFFIFGSFSFEHLKPYHIPCFYTEDKRFEPIWSNPTGYLSIFYNKGVRKCIQPDFSVYYTDPLAMQIFNIYRNFYLARLMQSIGIRIIPNLTLFPKTKEMFDELLPDEVPVVCAQEHHTQGYKIGREEYTDMVMTLYNWFLNKKKVKKFLVYIDSLDKIGIMKTKIKFPGEMIFVWSIMYERNKLKKIKG